MGRKVRQDAGLSKNMRKTLRVMDPFINLFMIKCFIVYTWVKTNQIVNFKYMQLVNSNSKAVLKKSIRHFTNVEKIFGLTTFLN